MAESVQLVLVLFANNASFIYFCIIGDIVMTQRTEEQLALFGANEMSETQLEFFKQDLASNRNKQLEDYVKSFMEESNKIEGIYTTKPEHIKATMEFLAKETLTLEDMEELVAVYQPNARIRQYANQNVRVGNHVPPQGGQHILKELTNILSNVTHEDAPFKVDLYTMHVAYETLHPFTDGNGRSGRTLWLWKMVNYNCGEVPRIGFLHWWYYKTLDISRK